ncbi:MAG: L,D-transpeptidase [Gammaproteobacteria bacterium]|nr:L,D-transpeptidase [Gammaproteobacteria bacterium]
MEQQINVDLNRQHLQLVHQGQSVFDAFISSAKKGAGEQKGSECTPRGRHIIRAKIGAGCAFNSVFIGRRPTGEIYCPELGQAFPARDWILTRILWLSGLQPGLNRLGQVDSMQRYIYIHGTPDSEKMGMVGSHGCLRMRNSDIVILFDLIQTGIKVDIK